MVEIAREMLNQLVTLVVDTVHEERGELPVRNDSASSEGTKNLNKRLTIDRKQKDRYFSIDEPIKRMLSVKKKIFIKNRLDSSNQI